MVPCLVIFEDHFRIDTRCLKIIEKVSFNIAIEGSYVYILSGQKLIENVQNGPFWRVFEKPEACVQTVLPDRSVLIGYKMLKNAIIQKFKCDILRYFQTVCITTLLFTYPQLRGET